MYELNLSFANLMQNIAWDIAAKIISSHPNLEPIDHSDEGILIKNSSSFKSITLNHSNFQYFVSKRGFGVLGFWGFGV